MSECKVTEQLDGIGVRQLIRLALDEDAPFGDISAQLCVPDGHRSSALVIAREDLVFCGELILPLIFEEFRRDLVYKHLMRDGARVVEGTPLLSIEGDTRAILQIERPLLNFLQRCTGVASRTAEIVAAAQSITVLDTRKTMPGWRVIDKYSVRVGGGKNHRFSLSDMILIKNNHIDAQGGDVAQTLRNVLKKKPPYMPIQVEVRTLEELEQVIPFSPTAVLLDNMNDAQIEKCLLVLAARSQQIKVEVSGGISSDRFENLARIGVSAVSLGSLTTAARSRDISLKISIGRSTPG